MGCEVLPPHDMTRGFVHLQHCSAAVAVSEDTAYASMRASPFGIGIPPPQEAVVMLMEEAFAST